MTDIAKHPLLRQCYELMQAIEVCGASTELTNAVSKASELLAAIDGTVVCSVENTQSDFSWALTALKAGQRVARQGWNGKDMWVCLGAGNVNVPSDNFWNTHTKTFAENNGGSAEVSAYLIMKSAQGKIQMGWAPTQSDLLAMDWILVE